MAALILSAEDHKTRQSLLHRSSVTSTALTIPNINLSNNIRGSEGTLNNFFKEILWTADINIIKLHIRLSILSEITQPTRSFPTPFLLSR